MNTFKGKTQFKQNETVTAIEMLGVNTSLFRSGSHLTSILGVFTTCFLSGEDVFVHDVKNGAKVLRFAEESSVKVHFLSDTAIEKRGSF